MTRNPRTRYPDAPTGARTPSGTIPRSATMAVLAVVCVLLASACGSAAILVVKPSKPSATELVPDPLLKKFKYEKILLLPPEQEVAVKELQVARVSEKKTGYYTAKLEKALVKKRFQVISPEIVARADKEAKSANGTLSAAEKAMIMGKKTQADAVFIVQSIDVRGQVRHFALKDEKAEAVEPGLVRVKDDGETVHAKTEQCLFAVPYYELILEAKLVEAATGNVLWLGTGKQRSTDVLRQDWYAELDGDCELQRQNFIYSDYLNSEETLEKTVTALFERMLGPLQIDAAIGQKLAREPKPAPPPPVKETKPEPKTAVVSSKIASLRNGPGKRHPRKARVTRKAKVEVIEVMGEWIKVRLQDGTVGWMHEDTLIINE